MIKPKKKNNNKKKAVKESQFRVVIWNKRNFRPQNAKYKTKSTTQMWKDVCPHNPCQKHMISISGLQNVKSSKDKKNK